MIPLDAALVKGSHGRVPEQQENWPVLVLPSGFGQLERTIAAENVFDMLRSVCLR